MRTSDQSGIDTGPGRRLAHALALEPFGPASASVPRFLAGLALVVAFTVSSPLMDMLGIPYAAPTGSFVYKLHPATWLLILAYAAALVGRGNPIRELGRSIRHQPATAAYVASVLLMIVWSAVRFGPSGAAFLIDTLLMPGVLALLLARLDLVGQLRLFVLACALLMGNALLGITEQIVKVHLIPITVGGGIEMIENLFRSAALLGHPLAAASVGGFSLFVFYRLENRAARFACCMTLVVALLSFGGRTSFAVNVALIAPLALIDLVSHARSRGLSYREVMGGTAVLILALGAVVATVAGAGVGERIMGSLSWDESAQARGKMLHVFRHMDWQQLMFGMSPDETRDVARMIGLDAVNTAIESFWLVIGMQVGLPTLALFTLCLAAFLIHLARLAGIAVGLGLIGFFAVASTSISLGAKTQIFVLVVALAYSAGAYRWLVWWRAAQDRPPAGRTADVAPSPVPAIA